MIYGAGPLFSQAELEFNVKCTKILENKGFEVYLPQRDTPQHLSSGEIFIHDKCGVEESNIVICVCDGADIDSGTAGEVGYAYALNKWIIALRTDFRYFEDTTNGVRGKFNLMISQCANYVIDDRDEIINCLNRLENENKSNL